MLKIFYFLAILLKICISFSGNISPQCEDEVIFEKELPCFKDNGDFLLNFKIFGNNRLLIHGQRPIIFSLDWSYSTNYSKITEDYQFFKGFENIIEITKFMIESIRKDDYNLHEKNGKIELNLDFKVIPKKFSIILERNEIKDVQKILYNIDEYLSNSYENRYFRSSSILYTNEMHLIKKWMNSDKDFKIRLVYKATEDGFSRSNLFPKKIENISPILVLIKSHLDFRFGGVSFKPVGNVINDEKPFIFSLDRKFKIGNIPLSYGSSYLIYFQNGFYIHENAATNYNSQSNLNAQQLKEYPKEINPTSFLAGSSSFLVKEIEIYEISFDS